MSKYKLQRGGRTRTAYGEPLSGYVDYKFAEVGEGRRERYLNNFYTTEAIRQSADALESAPFEGDRAYKDALLKSTDNVLGSIAQAGDYENMTVAVNRAATEYKKRTIPLAKNIKNFQDYQANLKDLYEKDKIDYEDYKGNMMLSTAMYRGLQTNDQGEVDPQSMFVGVDPVTNPDILKMLREQLNGMVPFEINSIGRRVGVGEAAQYEVETEQGLKYVDAMRVEQAMDAVMRDSRVQTYIGRKAEIRTGLLNPEQLQQNFDNNIEALQGELQNIDAQLASGSATAIDEGRLNSKKQRLTRQLGMLQAANGDPQKMQMLVTQNEVTNLNNMYRDSSLAKYTYQQEKNSQKVFWDDIYKKNYENNLNFQNAYPALSWESEVISQDNFYGNNDVEAKVKREKKVEVYNQLIGELDKFAGDGVSAEEVDKYVSIVRNTFRDISRGDDYFKWRYGVTNPALYDTEEYKLLEEKVETTKKAVEDVTITPSPLGGGSSSVLQARVSQYYKAIQDRDEYIKEKAIADPVQQVNMQVQFTSARQNPFFQTPDGQKRATDVDKAIMSLFSAPPATIPIYEPNTTELTTYRDATDPLSVDNKDYRSRIEAGDEELSMIPRDAKYASHGISFTPPNPFLGPMIAINYTSETRGTGTYHVPLNDALTIPDLNAAFGTPHMQAISEIGAFEAIPDISQGGANQDAMYRKLGVYSSVAGKSATMHVRYASAGPQAKIVAPGVDPNSVEWLDAYGDDFGMIMNNMDFRLQ